MLIGTTADDRALLDYAIRRQPCLVIDCANCANPHTLFPFVAMERLGGVYVVEVELIYALRDALKRAGRNADRINAKCIIVTSFHHLFNYGNDQENHDVYEHSWKLMKGLSLEYEVIVGIHTEQQKLAERFCDKIELVNIQDVGRIGREFRHYLSRP